MIDLVTSGKGELMDTVMAFGNAAQWETWLAAPWPEAKALQRPLPDGSLRIVLRGEPEDAGLRRWRVG